MRRWGATLIVGLGLMLGPAIASADAVGPFDPEAAQICGGSAHRPNCSPSLLFGGCCAMASLAIGVVGVAAFARGRASGSREGR